MRKLLLSVFMVLFAFPAFAAITVYNTPEGDRVDIYGSIRLAAAYQNSQRFINGDWGSIKSDLSYSMFTSSRFGINFKVDKFFGTLETNFNMDGVTAGFGFRQLFAGYDFGRGHKLTMGQQWSISGTHKYFPDFWMNDNSFIGFGVIASARRPMIKYSYYGLEIALLVNTDAVDKFVGAGSTDETGTITDYKQGPVYIPRFEIAYNFNSGDNLSGFIAATYGLFTERNVNYGSYVNVNAFHVAALVKPTFGRGNLIATAFYSMNGAMYGGVRSLQFTTGSVSVNDVMPDIKNGKVVDVHSWGVALSGAYNFNDILGLVIGAGWQMNISDKFKTLDGKKHDLDNWGAYVQLPVKLNKYMRIIPSVGYYSSFLSDTVKNTREDSGSLFAGAEFITNF